MKPLTYALLAAAAACGLASAETAYTTPVGYVGLGNTAGVAVPANTDMTIAIPLDRPAVYAGATASTAGSTLTISGTPGFTVGQFTATPHILKIESGAGSGVIALITANTADSVTVAFQNSDSFAGVVATDLISIRPAWTIGSLFAGNVLPDNIEFSLWEGSTVGTDNAPDKIYYYFGGDWYDSADDSDGNSIVLYPNEGFRLRNTTGTGIATLTVTGEVPKANSRIFIKGGASAQDTRISFFSSVDEPIATSGLGAADNDQLLSYSLTATGTDNAPSEIFYKFGSSWYDSADDSDVTATLKLKAGVGYVYRTAPGTPDTVSSNEPDYVPSL